MVLGPSERFRNIIGFLSTISTMIGVNVMNPNYRINIVTRFVMFAICVFYINLIYTIYVGIVIEDDWTIVLQVTALLPSALEGMTKLISVLKHQEGWRYLGMAFECVYVAYEQKNQCYRECLMKHVILTRKLLICCILIYFIPALTVVTFPFVYGAIYNERNNEVRDSIYNECLWYEMSVIEQKIVLIMLMKSQNTINLSVGRVMDLSMATALSVTKAIYSYAMVIYNFLQKDSIS
ncbi:odorant receptor 67d-like [Scaptodrosophila lebanonensis]|uniref:Odorant receptor 67d-like n=1 Tax=Drosophila lebanonensis TaxID=7225 RepID=A0A6J2UHM8_DROLE|nr:odorant receptor 67d-like [Scaptodrosophila lebanonensis]